MRVRKLVAMFGLVVVASPALTAGVAGANSSPPTHVSVDILGGDHFVHPGLMTNDERFPNDAIVVAQGGTRGDQSILGPDYCVYVTQTTTVEKMRYTPPRTSTTRSRRAANRSWRRNPPGRMERTITLTAAMSTSPKTIALTV